MVILRDDRGSDLYHYHETHTVWPTQRCNFEDARSTKWAVPIDDCRTRWFRVDFFPFDQNGEIPKEAMSAMNAKHQVGHVENLPIDWAEQVGAWWNLGHPWRQGNLWEDEVAQATQGPPERHYLPDWEKWHLATSDRGLLLNREVWREQIDRVREGLDPIGIVRGEEAKQIIRITSDDISHLTWDEGIHLFNQAPGERLADVLNPPDWLTSKPRGLRGGE